MKTKCCVPNCSSRRGSVKLHQFPKSAIIAHKWLEYIKCDRLKELGSEELCKFFVCHQHFEQRFVNETLRLKSKAYPTLFTHQELETGLPVNQEAFVLKNVDHDYDIRKRIHEDHTYCKATEDEKGAQAGLASAPTIETDHELISDSNDVPPSLKLPEALQESPDIQNHHQSDGLASDLTNEIDHILISDNVPSCKLSEFFKNFQETPDIQNHHQSDGLESAPTIKINHELISDCDNYLPSTLMLSEALQETPDIQNHHQSGELPIIDDDMVTQQCTNIFNTPKKKIFVIKNNNLTPRSKKIVKECKKPKNQQKVAVRAKRAVRFSKKEMFERITKKLNPLAKKILWMQINQCNKKSKGRRFTDEEKIIGLGIMKQSPETYKYLRKFFILPSTKTINKMLLKLQVYTPTNAEP